MKAFVTGSTGLLGSNLVRLLVAQGHEVKALVRSRQKAQKVLGDLPVTFVEGDMSNVKGFAEQLQGVDVLFHTAAYFREFFGAGDHWATLKKINIDAVLELFTEAEKANVRKVIHVSSSNVIGETTSKHADETSPTSDVSLSYNLYAKSKVLGDQAIAEFSKAHRLPIVTILPTWMFGPSDAAPTGSGGIVLNLLKRKLAVRVPGSNMIVDARDVAQAMINAVECGQAGERYIIGGSFYTLDQVVSLVGQISGVPTPQFKLPLPIMYAVAWLSQTTAQWRGKEALATVNAIRTLQHTTVLSSDKAKRELKINFRPLEETLRDEVAWYRAHGYAQ